MLIFVENKNMPAQTIQLRITGMTCGHCEKYVQDILAEQSGVSKAEVNHKTGEAVIQFDDAVIKAGQLAAAVNETVIYQVTETISQN